MKDTHFSVEQSKIIGNKEILVKTLRVRIQELGRLGSFSESVHDTYDNPASTCENETWPS